MIDRIATAEKVKDSLFAPFKLAKKYDVNYGTFAQFLWGKLPLHTPMALKIAEGLRSDGLLVETEEEQAA